MKYLDKQLVKLNNPKFWGWDIIIYELFIHSLFEIGFNKNTYRVNKVFHILQTLLCYLTIKIVYITLYQSLVNVRDSYLYSSIPQKPLVMLTME